MAGLSGVEIITAIKKASVWGTAAACGANDGVLILPDSLKRTQNVEEEDSLGLFYSNDVTYGSVAVSGDLPMYMRYDGCDLLMAMGMGETGGAPTQQGATAAYAQEFILANTLDDLMVTIAQNKKHTIEEIPTGKITGFTLSGEMGKAVKLIPNVIGNEKIQNSATNTLVTMANVTCFEEASRVHFVHGVFRINDQGGAALGSGDVVLPNSFELSLKRDLSGVADSGTGATTYTIDEPTINKLPEITLKLGFPRYSTTAYFLDWLTRGEKKMDMVFTGALIEDTYYRKITISIPRMIYKNVDAPTEMGVNKQSLEFSLQACSSAPTGMTVTKPFEIDVINRQSADVLA